MAKPILPVEELLPLPPKPTDAQIAQLHALLAEATQKFNDIWKDYNAQVAAIVQPLPPGIHYKMRATRHPEDLDSLRLFICRITKGRPGASMGDPVDVEATLLAETKKMARMATKSATKVTKKVVRRGKGGKILR